MNPFATARTPNALLFWISPEGRFLDASYPARRALGYRRKELLAMAVWDIYSDFVREDWPDLWQKLRHAKISHFQTSYRHRNGSQVLVEVFAHYLELDGHAYCCALVHPLTAHRQTENALRESEERLALTLAVSSQGLYDLDIVTGRATFNDEYARMLGYEPAELELTPARWASWLHPEDRERTLRLFEECLAGRQLRYQAQFRLRTRADDWIWVLSAGKVVQWDPAGHPLRLVGIHLNITEHKRAEAALRASEAFLDSVITQSPLPIVIFDTTGKIVRENQATRALLFSTAERGFDEQTFLAQYNLFQDEQLREQGYLSQLDRVFHSGAVVRFQSRYNLPRSQCLSPASPSRYVDLDSTTFPVRDANGNITHVATYHLDITDLKAAETKLRYHLDLEQAVAEISALMIKPDWEDFDARMNWTLERIGRLVQADRSYLFMSTPDGRTASNTHEWCALGIRPQIQDWQNLPVADYQFFHDLLRRQAVVDVQTASLPDDNVLKTVLLAGGVRALLCVPVNWGGTLRGFIGFDAVTTNRLWREEEIRLLRMVAELTAHTLQHIESDRALRDNARFLEHLDRISRILTQRESDADFLTDLAAALLEIFQADRAFLLHPCAPDVPSIRVATAAIRPEYPGAFAAGDDILINDAFRTILQQALRHPGPVVSDFATASTPGEIARHGIQSQMVIALHPHDDQPWLLSLHQCAHARSWTEAEQRLFQTIAERVSDALSGYLLLGRLKESEARFAKAFHASPAPMVLSIIATGQYLDVNEQWLKMLGYTREETIGRTSVEQGIWADPGLRDRMMAQLRKDGFFREIPARLRTRTGAFLDVLWSAESLQLSEQRVMLSLVHDITDRKRAEDALRLSEITYREIFNGVNDTIWIHDMETFKFLDVNNNVVEMFGYSVGEALDLSVEEISSGIPPFVQATVMELLKKAAAGKPQIFEWHCKHKNGHLFWTEVNLKQATIAGKECLLAIERDITERKRMEAELERHREHLEELVAARTAELQRANTELRQAMTQLVQSEKLAALGSLVAGVAHELNTPLGNARVVASTLGDDLHTFATVVESGVLRRSQVTAFLDRGREAVDLLERNTIRAANLINHFKQVAVDQTSARRRRFDLRQTVEELLATLQPQFKRTAHRLEVDIPPGLELDSYPGPLEQVIANLVSNSLIHGFAGIDAGVIGICAAIPNDGFVQLDYTDNGVGITEKIQSRIFDPFFTTKLGSGSSGLGLYIVYNIVSGVLGGTIEVRNTPHAGICFTLTLPCSAPHRPALEPPI